MLNTSDLKLIRMKTIRRMIFLAFLILIIVLLSNYTIKLWIGYIAEEKSPLSSLEHSYYKGEYDELFKRLAFCNERNSEEFLKYTEMALVYRSYEKFVFWDDVKKRCDGNDNLSEDYEKFRLKYFNDLRKRMDSLQFEENRIIMQRYIDKAGIVFD